MFVELMEIVGRNDVLPLSCIVCRGLLCLEETAAMGTSTASESAEFATSLAVSAATSAFCVAKARSYQEVHQPLVQVTWRKLTTFMFFLMGLLIQLSF